MSEKELAYKLIDSLPQQKLAYVIGYLQGLNAEEAADDTFCKKLYEDYLNDPDPEKTDGISLEECKKAWVIN